MAQKWEYTCCFGSVRKVPKGLAPSYADPSKLWLEKNKEGKTTWDVVNEYGQNGWEMVSATAIADNTGDNSYTESVLFTFKRPLP